LKPTVCGTPYIAARRVATIDLFQRGEQAVESLPKGIRENPEAIAETRELLDKLMPLWREYQEDLNRAPLMHESWSY
jgi:hypothetical protein